MEFSDCSVSLENNDLIILDAVFIVKELMTSPFFNQIPNSAIFLTVSRSDYFYLSICEECKLYLCLFQEKYTFIIKKYVLNIFVMDNFPKGTIV